MEAFKMHYKNIKANIRKQLKSKFPKWTCLTNKMKKGISQQVLDEVLNCYSFKQKIETPKLELLGIENQSIEPEILNLDQMKQFIENHSSKSNLLRIQSKQHPAIKDKELSFIDNLINDEIVNMLLSYKGYTPAMRKFFPSQFLRAELLKTIKFPEISYRKFCGDDKHYKGYKINNDYTGIGQKQNRAFIGLPLNRLLMIKHNQLSTFRTSLTFTQLVNITVYILHLFITAGYLGTDNIHCVDSTELALDNQKLLATVEIGSQKIRIYDDIDSDCGTRRQKRDKSLYVVGYRMHTLTAINPKTGQSFPLISLLAPANHHDSHFLAPLIDLGQVIGLDLKFITADDAYNDKGCHIYNKTGVHLIKPPGGKVKLPENVDKSPMIVKMDDHCEIPMDYVGIEGDCHEFKCSAGFGECIKSGICPKYRHIPIDTGYFQRIMYGSKEVKKALDIRKNGERPFNLIKKREGLDDVRVRSRQAVLSRSTFCTIATLLIEMAGTRKSVKKKKYQNEEIPIASKRNISLNESPIEMKKASSF